MRTTATPDIEPAPASASTRAPAAPATRHAAWLERAVRPVPSASLIAFRVAFGVSASVVAARFVARGWVEQLYLAPSYHFTYPGLSWVRPLPAAGMYAVYAVMVVAGLALAAGWRPRWSAAVFTLGFVYAEAIDVTTYLNHYELVTLMGMLCVALPLPARGAPAAATVPVWTVWLLRFQLAVVYVFAGLGKLDLDWLVRGEPLHTWLSGRTDLPLIGSLLGDRWVAVALSWGGAAFDLTVVAFLLRRRTRRFAYVAVVAFHAATGWLFPGIGAFPVVMVLLTPIFFEPDWPTALATRLRLPDSLRTVPPSPGSPNTGSLNTGSLNTGSLNTGSLNTGSLNTGSLNTVLPRETDGSPIDLQGRTRRATRLTAVVIAIWVSIQVVVPLRHLAYPGDVRWTEEGYRWSWRVLLTEKEGSATFQVTDPVTGRTRTVFPSDELAPHQVRSMAVRPDLLRQYAHHLADEAEARGEPRPAVRVEAWVAIAGHRRARLIDPRVDLAAEPLGLLPAHDIEPSPL